MTEQLHLVKKRDKEGLRWRKGSGTRSRNVGERARVGSRGSLGISAAPPSIPGALDQKAGISGVPPGYHAAGMP